jgi:hypothetical protein
MTGMKDQTGIETAKKQKTFLVLLGREDAALLEGLPQAQ